MTPDVPLHKHRLYDLELTEISLVDRPANPQARVLIIKLTLHMSLQPPEF